jgi:putative transposase
MSAIDEHRGALGVKPLCAALGVPRETYYRHHRPTRPRVERPRPPPPRALSEPERRVVLDALHSERFVNRTPFEVFGTLLDEGQYLCSSRTMYRILAANREVRERRNQLRHPEYSKPELLATAPNQVWTWDITKLLAAEKWSYFYLYVVLDIFSRYVVGWMLARSESAELARRLIRAACENQRIEPGELTIHSDRGAPMTSKTLGQLLADLGVEKSLSRPHVSNDNPFVESHFKTLKYGPGFPDRFSGGFDQAREHCKGFFAWYNDEHHHGGLAGLKPADVHHGRAPGLLQLRDQVLQAAYDRHPERFVRGLPKHAALPAAVWINPPDNPTATPTPETPSRSPAPSLTPQGTAPGHSVIS